VKREEGGMILREKEGATTLLKDNHLQFRFPSSKESMTPKATLNGSKKWTKFSIFI